MKRSYQAPKLVVYGHIADCTFTTPNGNVKGCQVGCHLDSFSEKSSLSTSGGS